MVDVPDKTPPTTPVAEPTVATEALLLLHEPGVLASVREIVEPTQTADVPEISDGSGLTLTVAVVAHMPVP